MVGGAAIFGLYEVSTALSGRERQQMEETGARPVDKSPAKVRSRYLMSALRVHVLVGEMYDG